MKVVTYLTLSFWERVVQRYIVCSCGWNNLGPLLLHEVHHEKAKLWHAPLLILPVTHVYRALDGELLAVIDRVYSFGICHRELHSAAGNILVVPDSKLSGWILLEPVWNILLMISLRKESTWLCCWVTEPVAKCDFLLKLLVMHVTYVLR